MANEPLAGSSHEGIRGTRNYDSVKTANISTHWLTFPEVRTAWITFTIESWFAALDSAFPRKEFLSFGVCTILFMLRPPSHIWHEHKHSIKYILGQKKNNNNLLPCGWSPSWKVCAFIFYFCFSFSKSWGWWNGLKANGQPLGTKTLCLSTGIEGGHWKCFPHGFASMPQSLITKTRGWSSLTSRWQLFSRHCYSSFQHQAAFQQFVTNLHFTAEFWVVCSFAFGHR